MKLILFLLTLVVCHFSYARIGLAEVPFDTPGGHTICHCDPYPSDEVPVLIGSDSLKQLEEWYFYKKHIIGKGNGYYFIFNEDNERLQYFKDEIQWKAAITEQELDPFFTRWLDISDSPDSFLVFLFFMSFYAVPLLLILGIFMLVQSLRKRMRWTTRGLIITSGLLVFLGVLVAFQIIVVSF